MMPLLSLIFSALFILFGTVVIQAFRLQIFETFSSETATTKNLMQLPMRTIVAKAKQCCCRAPPPWE